jgi:hypothetical protein
MRRIRALGFILLVAVPCRAREPAGCCQDAPLDKTDVCLATLLPNHGIDDFNAGFFSVAIYWHYSYDCSIGDPSGCLTCYRATAYYWSSTINDWVVAPGGAEAPKSDQGDCTFTYTLDLVTIYNWPPPPSPIKRGTYMQVIVDASAFDSSVSEDCDGQNYELMGRAKFYVPGKS